MEDKEAWKKVSTFDGSLSGCSLVCRHWAANIRPVIFEYVHLKSQLDAKRFSTAVSSPCKVPAPLNTLVHELTLDRDDDSKPWMYFVWALIRDGLLPNLREVRLRTRERESDLRVSQPNQRGRNSLYDLGLPRTMPSHAICFPHLSGLVLQNIMFPSRSALVRFITSSNTMTICCFYLKWLVQDSAPEPAVHSLLAGPFVPRIAYIQNCTAVLPFVWAMVTTRPPNPRAPQQRVHIGPDQINAVIGILSLFTDDHKSWLQHSPEIGRAHV